LPSEIHIFWPLSDQPESVFVARVRRLAASEPVSGSVRPKQPMIARGEPRQPALLLLLGAPVLDRVGDQRGDDRDDGAGGGVGAADRLDDQPVAEVIEAAAAVGFGDRGAEEADLTQLARQLAVEAFGAVVLADPRDDLPVGELARGLGDQLLLVGEVEVHPCLLCRAAPAAGLCGAPAAVRCGTRPRSLS
jgi:hypothetical protein